jgi:carbonic anhydrase
MVLREPEGISTSEANVFGKMLSTNARPTQPINGRVVKQSS